MKKIAFAFILVISIRGFGQKIEHYVTPKGDTIKVGDTVWVGPGTMPDGKYKYLTGFVTPDISFVGQRMTIKKILTHGNKKIGFKYYAKLYPGAGIVNYEAYIDYALKSGELSLSQ